MVTAISKLLLLIALLSSFGNALSTTEKNTRGLSFRQPHNSNSNSVDESDDEAIESYYQYKSGKSGSGKGMGSAKKSEKKSEKLEKYYYDTSYQSEISEERGKGMKSEKKEELFHTKNNYEVQYEVAIHDEEDSEIEDGFRSKSSKNRPGIPEFEFIEIGHTSYSSKIGKSSKYDEKNYYGSTGLKSEKAYKEGKTSKEGKSGQPKAPTISPAPSIEPDPASSPPTEVGTFGVGIPIYTLAYELMNKGEPKEKEVNDLNEATRSYLYDFFFEEFNQDDFTIFEQFFTGKFVRSSSEKRVVIDFDSIARFHQLSTITPTPVQLGSAVEEAFTGLEMLQYEDWLKKMLPSNNIFVGSQVEYVQGDEGGPDTSRKEFGATGIATSAVAFTLLVAGVVLYKSKADGKESVADKLNKSPGDMTVAGETFAGETYDGTASVSVESVDYLRTFNDEEEGMKIDNLRSIPDAGEDEGRDFGRGIIRNKISSAFRGSVTSAPRTASFEDVALQSPVHGGRLEENLMPEPSSEDDASQMSDSELSQFVASTRHVDKQTSASHTLEIKSILSMDSMDENTTGDLSVRDNSSRRLRTVAEIEALLSSELNDDSKNPGLTQHQTSRPRTVEEIESLLISDEDEDESIVE